MIAQVLNRQFVLEQMENIRAQLAKDAAAQRRAGPAALELEPTDYQEALGHLESALAKERVRSSGQLEFESTGAGEGGEQPRRLDDVCFISHEPVVSIVQSALEFYFEHPDSKDRAVQQGADGERSPAAESVPFVTDRVLPGYAARGGNGERPIFDPFSITDIGWVSSLVAQGIRKLRGPRAFNAEPPRPVEIGEQARLILVADWGTGIPRAQKVATAMRMVVEQNLAENRDLHVIHLGDVYYSGWEYEYRNRFLPHWPVRPTEAGKAGSWCLNANHDMYSGGYGYFDTLLKDERFRRQGQASFFRLFNRHWQILGLDTGWDDNGLKDPQGAWVKRVLDENGQKAMMLTHHQLFSVYQQDPEVGLVLREKLGRALDGKRIHAAFWGHEHRCMSFAPYGGVEYARLIGHGGVPVYMTSGADDPYTPPAVYEYREYIDAGAEHWALFGFAVLEFEGPRINVRYINENGVTYRQETIT